MAEFLNHALPAKQEAHGPDIGYDPETGFKAMGKPIPMFRRQAGYDHAKAMGVKSSEAAWTVVSTMAAQIERDKPYEAMQAGMKFLDLTGTYRMMSVLLTAVEVETG